MGSKKTGRIQGNAYKEIILRRLKGQSGGLRGLKIHKVMSKRKMKSLRGRRGLMLGIRITNLVNMKLGTKLTRLGTMKLRLSKSKSLRKRRESRSLQ